MKQTTFVFFMDLRSAFDCVSYNILYRKLEIMGIRRALLLIMLYLTNKKQTVVDNYNEEQSD